MIYILTVLVWPPIMTLVKANADLLADSQTYAFRFHVPPAPRFNDIYTNPIPTAAETETPFMVTTIEPKYTDSTHNATATEAENPFITNENITATINPSVMNTQIVELYQESTTAVKVLLSALSTVNYTSVETTVKPVTKTKEYPHVAPRRNYQRGILDLLLPQSRLDSFKTMFNSFKRLLSRNLR